MESTIKFQAQKDICPMLAFCSDVDTEVFLKDRAVFSKRYCELMGPKDGEVLMDGDKATGLQTVQGEKLMFGEPVAMGEVPETVNRVRDASKKAVRCHIEKAVAMQGDILALCNSDCINQAVQVAEMIRNTASLDKMIRDVQEAQKEGGLQAQEKLMKDFNEAIEVKLEALSLEANKDISSVKRTLLVNLIILNVAQHNLVKHVMMPLVRRVGFGPLSATFQLQLRHYWENGVQVKCDGYEPAYGYEYLGTEPQLCVTPVTRQAYVHLARCLYQGKGFFGMGPAGTGKTETAKDFYAHCGRHTVVINTSDQLTADNITAICTAARKSDFTLCFDEYNRLPVETATLALEIFKKESLGEQRGLTCTMNPGYAGRSNLPQAYMKVFDRYHYTIPDTDVLVQLMLWSEGLGRKSEELFMPFFHTFVGWKDHLSKAGQYDFGLRAIKAATRRSGGLHRDGMEQAVAVKTALNENMEFIYAKEDKDKYKQVLDQHFPGVEVAVIPCDMRQKIADANPDADDYKKEKMCQLWRRSRVRHSCMLLADDHEVVKGLLKATGGTMSLLIAKPKLDDAVIDEIKAALIKGQECENHWIVVQAPEPEFYWPEYIEPFNSLSDDNKRLTMKTNEIVKMAPTTRLVFVSADTKCMTPATISRNGIVNCKNA